MGWYSYWEISIIMYLTTVCHLWIALCWIVTINKCFITKFTMFLNNQACWCHTCACTLTGHITSSKSEAGIILDVQHPRFVNLMHTTQEAYSGVWCEVLCCVLHIGGVGVVWKCWAWSTLVQCYKIFNLNGLSLRSGLWPGQLLSAEISLPVKIWNKHYRISLNLLISAPDFRLSS